VLDQATRLPEHAIALPVSFFADADDRTFINAEAVQEIARVANRPVFVVNQAWVGSGAVGGYVMNPTGLGQQTAQTVLAVLASRDPPALSSDTRGAQWLFDAAQLKRWNIAARQLPGGSIVVNHQGSVWSQYRGYVIGALALIGVQAALISGLLVQGIRRRRAEQAARTSEAALRLSYERIRQLARRLIGVQETVRTRIARDLHDDVCQQLASVSMAVSDIKDRCGDIRHPDTQQALSALQRQTLQLVDGVRSLAHDLHPSTLRHVGLAAALEAYSIEVEQRYDVQVSVDTDEDLRTLPGDTAVALFRIAQEALRNAAVHGHARRVFVSVTRMPGSIALAVEDDGDGFDREGVSRRGTGLGMVSMEERARLVDGELSVRTAPGAGTTIRALVPLSGGEAPRTRSADPSVTS
jgi:signal transduction histidine kinase